MSFGEGVNPRPRRPDQGIPGWAPTLKNREAAPRLKNRKAITRLATMWNTNNERNRVATRWRPVQDGGWWTLERVPEPCSCCGELDPADHLETSFCDKCKPMPPDPERELYTLAEARQIILLEECGLNGHDFRVEAEFGGDKPRFIVCDHCRESWSVA